MKKFLFTLAALLMASTAFAESYLYVAAEDVVVTADDIANATEIEVPVRANFAARVSAWDCEFTYPEGMTVVFAEKGMDADVTTKNARGRDAVVAMTLWGAADPYTHMIGTLGEYGYWQDPNGENPNAWVPYGVAKWEGGEHAEMLILYCVFDENYHGGEITTLTSVSSGVDERGGTVREQGDHAKFFTHSSGELEDPNPVTPVEKTDAPVITTEEIENGVVVTATGNGHICLYVEDILVAEGEGTASYTIASTELEEEYGVSATAQEDGKEVSDYAVETVYVPAYVAPVVYTDMPVISIEFNYEEEYAMISATGNGTVKLYIDGMLVQNPFMYRFQDDEQTILVTATAQEDGKEISETAEETYVIPAKTPEPPTPEVTDKPTISYFVDMENEVVVVTATGNGHICLYWDDQLMAEGEGTATWNIPFCDEPEGEEYGVSATAQEAGKTVSEYALATIYVPGKTVEPYETPAPEVETNMTDDAFVITVTGEGQVVLHVQYIDNETGDLTEETYEGEGTVTVSIPRGEEDCYINFWATAQANEDAYPGISAVEYYVEIPAKEEVGPEDPHMTGYWLVEYNADGEKVYIELFPGQNGDYVNVDDVTYPEFYEVSSFYFLINGEAYGAAENMTEAFLGDADENPLVPGENTYYVGVGYSYTFGVHFIYDQNTMEFMGYSAYVAKGGPVDVDEVAAGKTVAGVRYYNMAGQEMQEANGMTIVVTTYTDGTTSAVKVIK